MKKEYLILIGIILALCAYLFVHKDNRDHYSLPQILKTDIKEITGIDILKDQKQISFSKKENKWTIGDKAYPADAFQIKDMLNVYQSFKLTSLVSEKGDLNRYELDKKHGIQIKYLKGDDVVFALMLGKTAPTFNHTFVKLDGDNNIYHAAGSLKSNFDKDIKDFRDKKVLSFSRAGIKQFTIAKGDISKTLTIVKEKNDKKQDMISWHFEDNTPADLKIITGLLSVLSDLRCETYPDTAVKEIREHGPALYRVTLKDSAAHELTLYKNFDNNNFSGLSSMNKYVFTLDKRNEKEIVTNIEKLLGIYKPEEPKE